MKHPMRLMTVVVLMVCLAACDVLTTDPTVTIKSNEIAVLYAADSGTLEVLSEGTYEINPLRHDIAFYPLFWQVYTFDDQIVQTDDALGGGTIQARTSDGQEVNMTVTIVFAVNRDRVLDIFKQWGSADYRTSFIRPQVRSVVRDLASGYNVQDLYAQPIDTLREALEKRLREILEAEGFLLQRVDVKAIQFSSAFEEAIATRSAQATRAADAQATNDALVTQAVQDAATRQAEAVATQRP